MKNIIVAIISLLASIVGMGIVCGKEISVYFCPVSDNLFYIFIFFISFFLFVFISLFVCNKYETLESLNTSKLGKKSKVFNCIIFTTYFIFLSSMFAAFSKLFSCEFCLFCVSLLFCFILVYKENKGLKLFSFLTMPAFILFVINYAVRCFNINFAYSFNFNINVFDLVKIVLYLAVNFLLVFSCLFKIKIKSRVNKFIVAFTVSSVLSILVFLMSNIIISSKLENESFPMLILSSNSSMGNIVFYFIVWGGITTTFCNSLFAILQMFKNKKESKLNYIIKMLSLLICSGLFSLLGFDVIIEVGYMVLGFFSLIYFIFILFVLPTFRKFSFEKCNSKIH